MGFLPWQGSTSGRGWTGRGRQPSCSQASKGQEKHVGRSPTPPNTPKVSPHQGKSPFVDTQLPHQTLHWPELLRTSLISDFYGILAVGEAKPTQRGLPGAAEARREPRHYLGTATRC